MTNAIPVFSGNSFNRSIAASKPPAEPPMPTIGQLKFFFGDFGRDFAATGLDCGDFVRFGFARERGARFDVGFAAMGLIIIMSARVSDKLLICENQPQGRLPLKFFARDDRDIALRCPVSTARRPYQLAA